MNDDRLTQSLLELHNYDGCGDNSCRFKKPAGMATNGGCRCFRNIGFQSIVVSIYKRLRVLHHSTTPDATQGGAA